MNNNDTISRQAAIDAAEKLLIGVSGITEQVITENNINYFCAEIMQLPPAQPELRAGYWIDDGSELGCQCSECGKSLDEYIHTTEYMTLIEIPKLCPNCGADMRRDTKGDTK